MQYNNSEFIIIFPIVLLLIIIFSIYFVNKAISKRNEKLDIEKNIRPIYVEICGGRFNGSNFTYPFVRLSIYDNFIVISYLYKIILYFEDIDQIDIKRNIFGKGLIVYHHNNNIPKIIILWSKNVDILKEMINRKKQHIV